MAVKRLVQPQTNMNGGMVADILLLKTVSTRILAPSGLLF